MTLDGNVQNPSSKLHWYVVFTQNYHKNFMITERYNYDIFLEICENNDLKELYVKLNQGTILQSFVKTAAFNQKIKDVYLF